MGHTFSSFSVKENVKIQDGIAEAAKAAAAGWRDIQNVKSGSNPSHAYSLWFGETSPDRIQHVFEVMSAINYALNSCAIQFKRDRADDDFAAAYPPEGGWKMKDVKQIVASKGFKIDIGNAYFNAGKTGDELKRVRGMVQGGEHPHTQAIIHEVSHIVGFTHDVGKDHVQGTRPLTKSSKTEEYYGKVSARILASRHPDFAIYNADNYAFYCCELFFGEA